MLIRRPHRRSTGRLAALLCGVIFVAVAGEAAAQINREQQVKAAYLYNFARFTTWPAAKLPRLDDPIRFCVLRDDPLAQAVHEALDGKAIDQHSAQVLELEDIPAMRDCHLAYIGRQGPLPRPELEALADAEVMTVYEGETVQPAGVVRLFIDGNRLRFEINLAAAERSHLTLSARLLSLARVLRD